jgi:O-antigen/teichoic acid export membrane protein
MVYDRSRLLKNLLSLTTSAVIARLVNFLATAYVARQLGAGHFGQFSFVLTIFVAYSMAANLGLENFVVRQVARTPETITRFIADAQIVKLLALPFGLLLSLFLWFHDPQAWGIILFLWGYSLMNATILFEAAIFRGLEKMELQTVLITAQAFLTTVSVVAVLQVTEGGVWVAAAYCLASAVVALAGWGLLWWYGVRPQFQWRPAAWGRLLRDNFPFTLALLGLLIFDRQAVVFIARFDDAAAVGWFNAVYFIILALVNIPLILINTLFPALSRATQQQDQTQFVRLYHLLCKLLWAISLPLTLGLVALAPFIVQTLYGEAFAPAARILQILAVSLPFLFLIIVLNGLLQTMDAPQQAAQAFLGCLLIAMPLTGLLSWQGGYMGGTVGYTLAAMLLSGVMWLMVQQQLSRRRQPVIYSSYGTD